MTTLMRDADGDLGPWLRYFHGDDPACYRWSLTLVTALGMSRWGGTSISEVHQVARAVQHAVGDDELWFRAWNDMADRTQELGEAALAAGHRVTASDEFLKSCIYRQLAERFAALTDVADIERVEIASAAGVLPAYLVLPRDRPAEPMPAAVFFGGLDITKELQYCHGVPELLRRGIACLVMDAPGTGEAVRLNGVHLRHDTEVAASPAYDLLAAREEIDADRIAVMAVSLGGYYASRSASRDPRFAACVAWGAIWDYHETWRERFARAYATALSIPGDHICWILGVDTPDQALAALEPFRLEGVVGDIRCPHLILHGEDDRQVPVSDARALFEASGSPEKELRVITAAEGGAQHTQVDHLPLGMSLIADWLSDTLRGDRLAAPSA